MPRTGLRYEVEIRFMSQNISKTPKLPPTEIMMQKFYNDKPSNIHTISIPGIRMHVFEYLKQLLYTSNLQQNPPNSVFSDVTQAQDNVTVEEMLHSVLVSRLNFQSAVAFISRTACHCPDLQTDIVMYVATLCNSILREASFR
ncbi:hypothetical protein BG000_010113 [Podila horticola]|nr:hypothetical protein BG000_010113 [Podila horticola]